MVSGLSDPSMARGLTCFFFQKRGRWKGDFLQDTTKTEVSYVYRKPNGAGLQVECGKLVVLKFSWCPLCASQCLGLYLRSVALVRVAELPLVLLEDEAEAR